jgi:hypothetical protein
VQDLTTGIGIGNGVERHADRVFQGGAVRALTARRKVLILDQQGSIGDQSGEYGGKYTNRAPAASIASRIPSTLYRMVEFDPIYLFDLILHFRTNETGIVSCDAVGALTGKTW